MSEDLDWRRDGPAWPNNEASRFVEAAGVRWHVQQMGEGPALLLVHGTGATTHSWRGLMPLLAQHFTVAAIDLPGHGFTSTPASELFTLPGMARGLDALLRALGVAPVLVAGHSAGAAILIRMALDRMIAPRGIVSFNGALAPLGGPMQQVFGLFAKLLVLNPLVPHLFSFGAGGRSSAERLLGQIGSPLDAEGVGLYARLMQSPRHVAGALAMMANWDLEPLQRDMPKLDLPLLLIAAGGDRAVPADVSFTVRDRVSGAKVEYLRGLGHLAHEEQPVAIADIVIAWARALGALAD